MPELPDVEIFKQYLSSTALHKKIRSVDIHSAEMLKGVTAQKLKKTLKGERFISTRRHGKHLFVEMAESKKWLVLHFGMTGFLKYFKNTAREPAHERLLIHFSNGYRLAYDCQRKLGEIALTDAPEVFIQEKELGPDALEPDFNVDRFKETLKKTRAMIKSALMNQKFIAGIGNVYSDEILFQAGIHPETRSSELDEDALTTLYSQTKRVLRTAIDARADPDHLPSTFIIPHRHGHGTCPKCKSDIEKIKVGGRTAYYCPQCQKG